jgi:lipoprotein-anchoring transpeptidase ErfK/SrfK
MLKEQFMTDGLHFSSKRFLSFVSITIALVGGGLIISSTTKAVANDLPAIATSDTQTGAVTPEVEPAVKEIHLLVNLTTKQVYVYLGTEVIAQYAIAIGKPGWETPKGTYRVFEREENPIFKSFKTGRIIKSGPENPLGTRWIGIWTDGKTRLGFHGTNQPELIGQAVSHGCIRMHNKDVTTLYEQVKVGTLVKIVQ